jgi:hypothetical protein
MQQLGPQFITTFLLPYIKGELLSNVEDDTRLQNLLRYDTTIRPEEVEGLKLDYFKNTETFLDKDLDARDLFWSEFIEFIDTEKSLCAGNVALLSSRLLPDPETGVFTKEAQSNLLKFSRQYVKAQEKNWINDLIRKKETSGEINTAEASNLRDQNEKDELLLARTKKNKGEYDILKSEQVRRASENVEKQAELLDKLFTEVTDKGEQGFLMNPPLAEGTGEEGREKSSPISSFQESVWENKAVKIEKKLAGNGFIVNGPLNVGKNGMIRGEVQDKKSRTRLIIETNIAQPAEPGKRRFRITFADKPQRRFWVNEAEIHTFNTRPAGEVYARKQQEEARKTRMPPTGKPVTEIPKVKPPKKPEAPGPRQPVSKPGEGAQPIMPERAPVIMPTSFSAGAPEEEAKVPEEEKVTGEVSQPERAEGVPGEYSRPKEGVIEAKRRLARRKRIAVPEGAEEGAGGRTMEEGKRKRTGLKIGIMYASLSAAGVGLPLWWALS